MCSWRHIIADEKSLTGAYDQEMLVTQFESHEKNSCFLFIGSQFYCCALFEVKVDMFYP